MPVLAHSTAHFNTPPDTGPAYIAGLGGTPGPGYFTDQHGQPIMFLCDECWGLAANAGRWSSGDWQGEIDDYLATRAGQGFTAVFTTVIGTSHSGNPDDTGDTWDGVAPFTTPYSVLNGTYWARIDYLLTAAAAAGLAVVLNVVFTYCLSAPANILYGINSGSSPHDYGLALGNRYKTYPNLIWHFGDDYDGSSWPDVFSGIIAGIRDAGDTHPAGIENTAAGSTSRYGISDASHASPYSWGGSYATHQWCYYYAETYFGIEYAYGEPAPLLPVIQGDGMYWGEVTGGTSGNDNAIRRESWWAVSSGARGYGTSQTDVEFWPSGGAAAMGSGSWYSAWAGNMRTLMESLPGWHLLIPDTSSALVTAGRGTRATYNGSAGQGYVSTNTYVTASRTPDGGSGSSLAVIYMPAAATITVDQSKMAAGYTATWADPATCATSPATPGTTYNSTAKGNNSLGAADWVLVLRAP